MTTDITTILTFLYLEDRFLCCEFVLCMIAVHGNIGGILQCGRPTEDNCLTIGNLCSSLTAPGST